MGQFHPLASSAEKGARPLKPACLCIKLISQGKEPPPNTHTLGTITSVLQTLHHSIVPYVCAAYKKVSLESADANYKFNLHFN